MEMSEEDVTKFSAAVSSNMAGASALDEYPPESPHHYNAKMRTSATHRRLRRKEIFNKIVQTIRGDKDLRGAVCADDEHKAKQLINQGVNVNKADDKLRTALHFAASKGNTEMVELLLSAGASPNLQDSNGNTPLHLAACTNHVPVVTLLLNAGTDLEVCDKFGHTPLHLALSRLKMARKCSDPTAPTTEMLSSSMQILKRDIVEIINMMEAYLQRSKLLSSQQMTELHTISQQLDTCHTRPQIDEVNDILQSFTNMAITSGSKADETSNS